MLRFRALVARDPFFATALTAGAGLRLLAMLGYPGALWFAGDSYVYVGAALRLRPNLSKTTGYSLFLKALEPFHSLSLVAGLQHLMGLAVAVMIYLLLRRHGVSPRWATVATLPVLLDGFVIEDEHMVMAEALFTFLVMLSMLLILWRGRVSWPVALLAGLLAGYAVVVRSVGLPVLVLFPVVLLLRGLRRDGAWAWRNAQGWLAAAVMAIGCAAPVVSYAGWFHSWYGSYGLTRSDGFYLWGRMSSFAECAAIKPPADELKICPSGPPSSRTPPGDYIWHAPQVRDIAGGPVSAANNALLRDFAIRAVEAQPLGYVHAVLGGLALTVEWPRHEYPDPGTVHYYYFQLTPQTIPANRSWIPGGTAYSRHPEPGHPAVREPDRPVPAGDLHLRAAVRPDPAGRPRRGAADQAPPGTMARPGLVAPRREHAALADRRHAAGVPGRGGRLRLPLPAPRSAVRLPRRGPGIRAGPGGRPGGAAPRAAG